MDSAVEPFRIDVRDDVLADLRQRLERSRVAHVGIDGGRTARSRDETADEWVYGTSAQFLSGLIRYWIDGFDWRARERELNRPDRFVAPVDGQRVHFIHEPGEGADPLPIVLLHGWPSGHLEMTRLSPRLSRPSSFGGDPAASFNVVVPSLPGFGYSQPLPPGQGYARVAELIHELMVDVLGYPRFGLHSTGAGAFVAGRIALEHPESVVGYHTHDPNLMPGYVADPSTQSAEEAAFRARAAAWGAEEGAYAALHRTKPLTLAHALTDSPTGLASWLVEKHRMWSDCDGEIGRRYSDDELLTQVMWYWVTDSIGSSIRMYYERVHHDPPVRPGTRLEVPSGIAMPRDDPRFPPRRIPIELARRTHDVRHWVDLPSGGHFASWEEPDLVANSITSFFGTLR